MYTEEQLSQLQKLRIKAMRKLMNMAFDLAEETMNGLPFDRMVLRHELQELNDILCELD